MANTKLPSGSPDANPAAAWPYARAVHDEFGNVQVIDRLATDDSGVVAALAAKWLSENPVKADEPAVWHLREFKHGEKFGPYTFVGYSKWQTGQHAGEKALAFEDESRYYLGEPAKKAWLTTRGVLNNIPQLVGHLKRKKTMKELNAAALLREDTITVEVAFESHKKSYTYVATKAQDLRVGDFVVVQTGERYNVAEVKSVHDELGIEPQADIEFKWVVSKVDLADHLLNMDRNKAIEERLKAAYVTNARQAFRRSLNLEDGELQKLLGGS